MPKIDKEKEIERLLDKDLSQQLDFIEVSLSQKQGRDFYLGLLMLIVGRIEDVGELAYARVYFHDEIKARIGRAFQAKIEQIIEEENE